MENDKLKEKLEMIVEKNMPRTRVPQIFLGIGIVAVSIMFDYGMADDILRMGAGGYVGWQIGGLLNYSMAKRTLEKLYKKSENNNTMDTYPHSGL